MRSNSKAVRELVKSHILSYYETVESLKADLMALYIDHRFNTLYNRGREMVNNGCFYAITTM